MLVIQMMYDEFKDVAEDKLDQAISDYILCYDNMCHLDNLRAAKTQLPLPAPYDQMWSSIHKIIGRLHLPNHKDARCKENYNANNILPEGYNTMASEQLFAWMGRFKKIVLSMTQIHHLFYLHPDVQET